MSEAPAARASSYRPAWLIDAALAVLALFIADQLRLHVRFGTPLGSEMQLFSSWLYPAAGLVWLTSAYLFGVYDKRTQNRLGARFSAWAATMYALAMLVYLIEKSVPRLLYLYLGGTMLVLLVGLATRLARGSDLPRRSRVALIGAGQRVVDLALALHRTDHLASVVGYIVDGPAAEANIDTFPVLGGLDRAMKLVREHDVDRVVLATPRPPRRELIDLAVQLRRFDVEVQLAPDSWDLAFGARGVHEAGGTPLVPVQDSPLSPVERRAKRLLDLLIAVPLLAALSPLLLLVGLAIRLDSPGSPLFAQYRVGENGRLFKMLKFRTMVADAEQRARLADPRGTDLANHKRRGDPRITRIGAILRRASLDELPQLINVARGEMSLVGPRPELPLLVGHYEPWQYQRFAVPQGMTGWWQVNGRSDCPLHENTQDDLFYIRNYSLWLDLKILLRTPTAVLAGRGAY